MDKIDKHIWKTMFLVFFNIASWLMWLFVIYKAVIDGGEFGIVRLSFNRYNEMWLEFYVINGIFLISIILSIGMIRSLNKLVVITPEEKPV